MDPLSVTASVAAIAGACLATAKTLSDLRSKYKDAQMTIAAICAETTVIGTTLAKIQGILLSNPQALTAQIQAVPGLEIQATFDIALTGCSVIYSCLDVEVQKLKENARGADGPGWTEKAKFLWKEDTMRDLLNHLQRQQGSISLLISVLQIETIADIHRLVKEKNSTDVLESTAVYTRSLRTAYPQSRVPESIFNTDFNVDARFGDTASVIGSSMFDFDDDVVNSQVYRRTLISARQYMQQPEGGHSASEGFLSDVEPIIELNSDNATLSQNSRERFQVRKLPQGGQPKTISSTKALRYCSESVMGLWALRTHRRFRTSELRFEVLFDTPVIFLAPPSNTKGPIFGRRIYNIDGSDASYAETNTMKPDKELRLKLSYADDEQASWVTLLGAIQREEAESREWELRHRTSYLGHIYDQPVYTICHSIQAKSQSYDFMPPAVTKPYATTTIAHLVEMTAMLGMCWKVFEEIGGNLRAEGNGYILTSTTVHGLGLMVKFSVTGMPRFTENRVIPSHDIKELVFGFVPNILGSSLEFGIRDGMKRTFARLNWESDLFELWQEKKDRSPIRLSVTFELVAMLARPFRIRCSKLKMIPNPTAERWPGDELDIDWHLEIREFWVLFRDIAQDVRAPGATLQLLSDISRQWPLMDDVWLRGTDMDEREFIHDGIDLVDQALQRREDFSVAEISSVVASHLKAVLDAADKPQTSTSASLNAEGKLIKYYVKHVLPYVKDDGPDLSENQRSKCGVIWLALMFRMISWFLLHDFQKMDINIVPSDLRGSRMPVFIS